MAKNKNGRFVVAQLDDGRFVATSDSAPYFCFRGQSEEEVLEIVRRAVTFCHSRTDQMDGRVNIKPLSQTVTSVAGKPYNISDVLEAA